MDTKGYAEKYKLSGKEVIKIGVTFDNEKRTVKKWKPVIN
ncbi:MAG: PD-(D/E)XK nuclease domain-containing protein [Tannerella sp.]|nr:PD-(D/E)XK nuclease domain-containing protein [Tannerella sp.]